MSKRGPKPKAYKMTTLRARIPAALADKIDETLPHDPITGRPKKGERSELVISLLLDYLERQKPKEAAVDAAMEIFN